MAATPTGEWPEWVDEALVPFAETIDRAKRHVVSSTLDAVGWNAELVQDDLGDAVRALKAQPGRGGFIGGVTLHPRRSPSRAPILSM